MDTGPDVAGPMDTEPMVTGQPDATNSEGQPENPGLLAQAGEAVKNVVEGVGNAIGITGSDDSKKGVENANGVTGGKRRSKKRSNKRRNNKKQRQSQRKRR
jgi:hypothetical protein